MIIGVPKEIKNNENRVSLTPAGAKVEARLGLWNYISAHFSMVDEVKGYNYTNEPIAFLLEDSEIKETIRPYIMARITDVKGFINNYPFLRKPKNKKINLIIKDDMAKWNNASFMIYWHRDW